MILFFLSCLDCYFFCLFYVFNTKECTKEIICAFKVSFTWKTNGNITLYFHISQISWQYSRQRQLNYFTSVTSTNPIPNNKKPFKLMTIHLLLSTNLWHNKKISNTATFDIKVYFSKYEYMLGLRSKDYKISGWGWWVGLPPVE